MTFAEVVRQIAEAAVVEARSVRKLLERDGHLYWRSDGHMIPMTEGAPRRL